jgi:hypothetical protein
LKYDGELLTLQGRAGEIYFGGFASTRKWSVAGGRTQTVAEVASGRRRTAGGRRQAAVSEIISTHLNSLHLVCEVCQLNHYISLVIGIQADLFLYHLGV